MAGLDKPSRVLRLIAQHGAIALKSAVRNGRYYAPMVSPRMQAVTRKKALLEGTYGSFSPIYGGWDPAWDKIPKMYLLKPYKGHKRERTRQSRADKITAAMKVMPDRISKYKQEIKDKKPKKDILSLFRRAKALHSK